MIKTTYQTPEIRDSNDNIVQQGAFGKNTALSNSDNTGWIDYVVNNLEALHDTIGDSAAHLDGNGHVVEPANLAIGDEDGNRLKTSYLKLTGGTVAGTLNVAQNLKIQDNQENVFGGFYVPPSSATQQFLQIYGGENASAGNARLTLFPAGDGSFALRGYSTDGATSYELKSSPTGNLNWRGYPLAWKKDYLPLAGGTMTGILKTTSYISRNVDNNRLSLNGGSDNDSGAYLNLYGKDATSELGSFSLTAYDGTTRASLYGKTDGTLTWRGNPVAMANNVLPLSGGTMTGTIKKSSDVIQGTDDTLTVRINGGTTYANGAFLLLYGKSNASYGGYFYLRATDGTSIKDLHGRPDGTLTWGTKEIERVYVSGTNYIRYESGLQICWGNNISFNTSGTAINLPVAFKDATYGFVPVGRGISTSTNCAIAKLTAKTTTAFTVVAVATNNLSSFTSGTIDYIAIGLWK